MGVVNGKVGVVFKISRAFFIIETPYIKTWIRHWHLSIYDDLFLYILVDEEKIYLRAFELKSNFVPVLSYASRGKLGPIIEGLRY